VKMSCFCSSRFVAFIVEFAEEPEGADGSAGLVMAWILPQG
jgi:hypothetical protein